MKDQTDILFRDTPQLYALLPGTDEPASEDMRPVDPRVITVLSPCLNRGRGTVPDELQIDFGIEFGTNTAKVRFFAEGELIVSAAVAWGLGEEATAVWKWVCGSMSSLGCSLHPALPAAPIWAAMALPPAPLPTSKERIFAACAFMSLLAPAIIGWRQRQN